MINLQKKFEPGDTFKSPNNNLYALFSAPMDLTKHYLYLANFTNSSVVKLSVKELPTVIKDLRLRSVDIGLTVVKEEQNDNQGTNKENR